MVQLRSVSTTSPENREIPELSGGAPLIGHLWEFQRDPVAMLDRGQRELGDLFRFRLGPREFVLFASPEAHDAFFSAPEDQLNAKAVYQFTVPIFGRGVAYDVAPQIMDEQLGFLYPALRETAMQQFARIMFEETSQFADSLGEAGEIDLPTAMNELTVRIAQPQSDWTGGPAIKWTPDSPTPITTYRTASTPWVFSCPGFRYLRIAAVTEHASRWPRSSSGSWRRVAVRELSPTISCSRSWMPPTRMAGP